MARFTNIGMPRKSFVASAAEESRAEGEGAERNGAEHNDQADDGGKRKGGWGRDPEIAKRARMNHQRTEDRRNRRIDDRKSVTTCFACRGVGHAARDCPNILLAASGASGSAALLEADKMAERQDEAAKEEKTAKTAKTEGKGMKRNKKATGGEVTGGKCYRCNSAAHSLSKCPKPVDKQNPTPFATCFVCLGSGHLSAVCPQNSKGVYVRGGSCKICGSVQHLVKDCPQGRPEEKEREVQPVRPSDLLLGTGKSAGADEDDFMVATRSDNIATRSDKPNRNRRHAPANNSQRGPAKQPGEEGAFASVPTAPAAAAKPKPKSRSKVVSF